jgi:hypothetical protein
MSESTQFSILAGGRLEIETGQGMGLRRSGTETEIIKQLLADDMRGPTEGLAKSNVVTGLSIMHWQQLCVAVGEVQQRQVTHWRQVVLNSCIGGTGR